MIYTRNNPYIVGGTWIVHHGPSSKKLKVFAYKAPYGVVKSNEARLKCAEEAHAGDPDAIVAVMICQDDKMLQGYVRRLNGE